MTADCLQRHATRLGNSCWCRHWLHWNYPARDQWLMAIWCKGIDGHPLVMDLESEGFAREDGDGLIVYTIARTDAAGQPYRDLL